MKAIVSFLNRRVYNFGTFITDNTLGILVIFLLLIVATRIGNTYFSPSGRLRSPEQNFATETLGRDFVNYSVAPWYQIMRGQTPFVFGYGSVLVAGAGISLCNGTISTCGTPVYQGMIAVSVLGLVILLLLFIKQKSDRVLATIIFCIFLLGVPMNKALEAGNPDVFLSVLFGIMLFILQKQSARHRRSVYLSMILGILLGFMLNVKGFLLLFVLAALVLSAPDATLYIWFIVSFISSAMWPWLYGVKSGILDVFTFALRDSATDSQTIFTRLHYGNNAIVSYVSNILQTFGKGSIPIYVHQILTYAGSIILALLIYIKPIFDEGITSVSVKRFKQSLSSFPFYLLVFTVCYVIMLTATAWSYDYRIMYALPLIFCFIGQTRDKKTTLLLYLSILSLLTKSLYIPKDRIMTVFLYLHFYFLLRASLSLWKNTLRFV